MNATLDLTITFAPAATAADVATWTLSYASQTASGTLAPLITDEQRSDLRWYLEEYIDWPFMEFRTRGDAIAESLVQLGQGLFKQIFKSSIEASEIFNDWDHINADQRTLNIRSDLPAVLALPWELLHDGRGFLAQRKRNPVAIIRTVSALRPGRESLTFTLPLRVLMVVARPDNTGFLDPRSSARTILQALELLEQAQTLPPGSIEVEFLRPPTFAALSQRLEDSARPIHILHFDGHGTFADAAPSSASTPTQFKRPAAPQGYLAFENAQQDMELIAAKRLASQLNDAGVRVVMLDACQTSRMSEQVAEDAEQRREQALGSVATSLLNVGVDAVVAMSASVLVTATAIFFGELYRRIASGVAVPTAIERARQALETNRVRHLYSLRSDEAPEAVELVDWWLPHYYQQRPVSLQPSGTPTPPPPISKSGFPVVDARRVFVGRARELLEIERSLGKGKMVVLQGFGGIGKTTLAVEAAAWLTRTGMYKGAVFVSFEHSGDATTLLGALARHLNADETLSHDPAAALLALAQPLRTQPTLIIADNLESLLPTEGEEKNLAELPPAELRRLWDTLAALATAGAGVILTSRDVQFGDARLVQSRTADVYPLRGLAPADAYTLATTILDDLKLRDKAPYVPLRDLLIALDHHPLALHLVLPALADHPIERIASDFTALLTEFKDSPDAPLSRSGRGAGGEGESRNASLLASLAYSLRRLSTEQHALLIRLAPFEGGASEDDLLEITEIPEAAWRALRPALEHAALLTVEPIDGVNVPFLRFHPILAPYLRGLPDAEPAELHMRYIERYHAVSRYLYHEDSHNPIPVRALARRELPNLRRALDLLFAAAERDAAIDMADNVSLFLLVFGMTRERAALTERLASLQFTADGSLSHAEYLRESNAGEAERGRGTIQAAYSRFTRLLERIAAQPASAAVGPGSYAHCLTLQSLARCLSAGGQPAQAERILRQALSIIEALIVATPDDTGPVRQHGGLLTELGDVLREQGHFAAAREAYEAAIALMKQIHDTRSEGAILGQLGLLALQQRNFAEAEQRYQEATKLFQQMGETASAAIVYHQLGRVMEEQHRWNEAEDWYRQSLALKEQANNLAGAATTCNQLAIVAKNSNRPSEAEGWYRRTLELSTNVGHRVEQARNLNNLASLLKDEVQAGRQPQARLAEARQLAERALAIRETLDASSEIWTTLSILAQIAEIEGRPAEARAYRRRERETYAQFAGNRWHIDQQFGKRITAIAAAALGDEEWRAAVEEALPELEQSGWKIAEATRRIWAGERDWQGLCEDLDGQDALLVLRVLEEIGVPSPPAPLPVGGRGEQIGGEQETGDQAGTVDMQAALNSLPVAVRTALEQQDGAAFNAALAELPDEEREQAITLLEQAGLISRQQITPEQLIAQLPEDFREALERQDHPAAQRILEALPEAEQARVAHILQALQEMQGGAG